MQYYQYVNGWRGRRVRNYCPSLSISYGYYVVNIHNNRYVDMPIVVYLSLPDHICRQ